MRKIILIVLFFCGPIVSVQAQNKLQTASTPQAAITNFFDSLSELDTAKMNKYITTDFLLLENGEIWNADSLAVNMAFMKGKDFSRKNTFKYFRTEENGNEAIVAYHNRADITFNGKPMVIEWMESAHLVKHKQEWKIKMMHSTALKPKNK